jgi:hypothetical protein
MTASQVPATRQPSYDTQQAPAAWTGWVIFAGIMLIMVGTFQIIEALTALFRHSYYAVNNNQLLVRVNYTGWGWIHLVLGALLVCAGFGLFAGQMWARVVGVLLAGLSAVANLVFIAANPFWSLTVIFLDILVIYAISVHGREMRADM